MLTPVRTDQLPPEKGAGVSLWYVASRLGLSERCGSYILGQVRLLHAHEGFPAPFPDYVLSTGRCRRGINLKSRWARPAVDAWFDGRIPPELAAAADAAAHTRDAELLDERAALAAAA